MQTAVAFFLQHAGYSWNPQKETRAQGRRRTARRLASAEAKASEQGYQYQWEIDPCVDSSEFSDAPDPWQLWSCCARNGGGHVVATLGGVDFGRDGQPWGNPYSRVVQAELAAEGLAFDAQHPIAA